MNTIDLFIFMNDHTKQMVFDSLIDNYAGFKRIKIRLLRKMRT